MGRIARLCHASQLSSVDHLNRPYTLGACDAFHLKTFRLEHGKNTVQLDISQYSGCSTCVCACVCVCVRACVRACVCAMYLIS